MSLPSRNCLKALKRSFLSGQRKGTSAIQTFHQIKTRKKKLFLMSSQASPFFLLSYYPTERIGLFLPSNSTLFLQCLLLRSLVLFMFSVVIQFKKERNKHKLALVGAKYLANKEIGKQPKL